jgi:hypothetical protein
VRQARRRRGSSGCAATGLGWSSCCGSRLICLASGTLRCRARGTGFICVRQAAESSARVQELPCMYRGRLCTPYHATRTVQLHLGAIYWHTRPKSICITPTCCNISRGEFGVLYQLFFHERVCHKCFVKTKLKRII